MSRAFEQVAIVLSFRGDQPSWVFPRKFLPVQWIFAMLLQLQQHVLGCPLGKNVLYIFLLTRNFQLTFVEDLSGLLSSHYYGSLTCFSWDIHSFINYPCFSTWSAMWGQCGVTNGLTIRRWQKHSWVNEFFRENGSHGNVDRRQEISYNIDRV